jgi:hypothetical protein
MLLLMMRIIIILITIICTSRNPYKEKINSCSTRNSYFYCVKLECKTANSKKVNFHYQMFIGVIFSVQVAATNVR